MPAATFFWKMTISLFPRSWDWFMNFSWMTMGWVPRCVGDLRSRITRNRLHAITRIQCNRRRRHLDPGTPVGAAASVAAFLLRLGRRHRRRAKLGRMKLHPRLSRAALELVKRFETFDAHARH